MDFPFINPKRGMDKASIELIIIVVTNPNFAKRVIHEITSPSATCKPMYW